MSERPTPETDSQIKTFTSISKLKRRFEASTGKVRADFARKLERERDEARDAIRALAEHGESEIQRITKERDEAREELSSIHRWIERNHADGFIDSLTFLQNLERVVDCWYDRIDEAREKLAKITRAAEVVIDRWEQPAWKDTEPTATVIYRLRDALGREAE